MTIDLPAPEYPTEEKHKERGDSDIHATFLERRLVELVTPVKYVVCQATEHPTEEELTPDKVCCVLYTEAASPTFIQVKEAEPLRQFKNIDLCATEHAANRRQMKENRDGIEYNKAISPTPKEKHKHKRKNGKNIDLCSPEHAANRRQMKEKGDGIEYNKAFSPTPKEKHKHKQKNAKNIDLCAPEHAANRRQMKEKGDGIEYNRAISQTPKEKHKHKQKNAKERRRLPKPAAKQRIPFTSYKTMNTIQMMPDNAEISDKPQKQKTNFRKKFIGPINVCKCRTVKVAEAPPQSQLCTVMQPNHQRQETDDASKEKTMNTIQMMPDNAEISDKPQKQKTNFRKKFIGPINVCKCRTVKVAEAPPQSQLCTVMQPNHQRQETDDASKENYLSNSTVVVPPLQLLELGTEYAA
ncbi:serine/arginine repetitive matrix protein 2-like [Ambystoma mexicanum]|uniref:serine/arginine repetitive matrix protein 2-like n=1 Tax=Ambystoma mexicanum TaxID=8296 RepID=UPI0037E8E9FC